MAAAAIQPIVFSGPTAYVGFGSFRLVNARQFNTYVSGKFYDKVFYAPKDLIVLNAIGQCFNDPGEYCDPPQMSAYGDRPYWSSYALSPAAMFLPDVMEHDEFKKLIDEYVNTNAKEILGGFTDDDIRMSGLSKQMIIDVAYKVYRVGEPIDDTDRVGEGL